MAEAAKRLRGGCLLPRADVDRAARPVANERGGTGWYRRCAGGSRHVAGVQSSESSALSTCGARRRHRGRVPGRIDNDDVLLREPHREILEKMAAHGDKSKPLWLSVVPSDRLGEGAVDIQPNDARAFSLLLCLLNRELAGIWLRVRGSPGSPSRSAADQNGCGSRKPSQMATASKCRSRPNPARDLNLRLVPEMSGSALNNLGGFCRSGAMLESRIGQSCLPRRLNETGSRGSSPRKPRIVRLSRSTNKDNIEAAAK
jgi:hypothetical protein